MAAFDYRQAEELKRALDKQQVRYLFIGKSAAIILGFPDTTQDADLFIDRSPENGRRLTAALLDLGFELTSRQAEEIERGKVFRLERLRGGRSGQYSIRINDQYRI